MAGLKILFKRLDFKLWAIFKYNNSSIKYLLYLEKLPWCSFFSVWMQKWIGTLLYRIRFTFCTSLSPILHLIYIKYAFVLRRQPLDSLSEANNSQFFVLNKCFYFHLGFKRGPSNFKFCHLSKWFLLLVMISNVS